MIWCVAIIVCLVLVGGVAFGRYHSTATRQRIRDWAELNGYSVLSIQYKYLSHGPFFFVASSHSVYRITVRDSQGRQRTGWLRTGKLFDNNFEIKWEDEIGPVRMSWILPVALLIGGAALLVVPFTEIATIVESFSWSEAAGKISDVKTVKSQGKSSDTFCSVISYSYVVDDRKYGGKFEQSSKARDCEYQKGNSLTVIYSPANPASHRLTRWPARLNVVIMGLSGLFLLLGLVLFTVRTCRASRCNGA